MADAGIHQLYCTHCTYGTSALHRSTQAVKDQVFEYSARAGSVPQERSHDVFRAIESAMYFHLPGDTPAAEMLKLTADSAPWRRLVYFPSIGGYRMVARICYRQTDTRGRPGSYFAHVLLEDLKDSPSPWSPADCLKLWGASWTREDSPAHPFKLDHYTALDRFPGFATAIHDKLLLEFLNAPAGSVFTDRPPGDPLAVIPARWRDRTPDDRRKLFADVLHGAFNLDLDRRERMLLGVEPGLAALLFYGVARMAPSPGWGERFSFSTFESHLDRPSAVFVATDFFNRQTTDFNSDAYRAPGVTINTFNGRASAPRRPSPYATEVLKRFLDPAQGPAAVDALVSRLARHGAALPRDWEQLIEADELSHALVHPDPSAPPISDRQLPSTDKLKNYLRLKVVQELSQIDPATFARHPVCAAPDHILMLLSFLDGNGAPDAAAEQVTQRLLSALSDQSLPRLLGNNRISRDHRLGRAVEFLRTHGRLTPECADLWNVRPGSGPSMLTDAFRHLNGQVIKSVFDDLLTNPLPDERQNDERFKAAFRALLESISPDLPRQHFIVDILQHDNCTSALREKLLSESDLRLLLAEKYPLAEPVLPTYLLDLLDNLPQNGRQFRLHLGQLTDLKRLLPEDRQGELAAWEGFRTQLQRLDGLVQEPPGLFDRWITGKHHNALEDAGEHFAQAALRALPDRNHHNAPADTQGERRAQQVATLARYTLSTQALPDGFQPRLAGLFAGRGWTRAPGKGIGKVLLMGVAALLLLSGVGGGAWYAVVEIPRREKAEQDALVEAKKEKRRLEREAAAKKRKQDEALAADEAKREAAKIAAARRAREKAEEESGGTDTVADAGPDTPAGRAAKKAARKKKAEDMEVAVAGIKPPISLAPDPKTPAVPVIEQQAYFELPKESSEKHYLIQPLPAGTKVQLRLLGLQEVNEVANRLKPDLGEIVASSEERSTAVVLRVKDNELCQFFHFDSGPDRGVTFAWNKSAQKAKLFEGFLRYCYLEIATDSATWRVALSRPLEDRGPATFAKNKPANLQAVIPFAKASIDEPLMEFDVGIENLVLIDTDGKTFDFGDIEFVLDSVTRRMQGKVFDPVKESMDSALNGYSLISVRKLDDSLTVELGIRQIPASEEARTADKIRDELLRLSNMAKANKLNAKSFRPKVDSISAEIEKLPDTVKKALQSKAPYPFRWRGDRIVYIERDGKEEPKDALQRALDWYGVQIGVPLKEYVDKLQADAEEQKRAREEEIVTRGVQKLTARIYREVAGERMTVLNVGTGPEAATEPDSIAPEKVENLKPEPAETDPEKPEPGKPDAEKSEPAAASN